MTFTNESATNGNRSLYVHIPFCRHRCGYCNFSLIAGRDHLIDRFLNAIEVEASQVAGRPSIGTLFLGGGTPSHLERQHLQRLVEVIGERFSIAGDVEFSIECNPSDFDVEKRDTMGELGINRISFGVQSFRDAKLELLQRDHRSDQILEAFALAKTITQNISFDLIFATPDETLQQWEGDLECAIDCSPSHISTYELTIEKGTQFWNRQFHGGLSVPDEDRRFEFYARTIERLALAGYEQYEISSFCRPGFRCRHNSAYWNGNDYFALGPGAASYVDGIRRINHRSTMAYLKRIESGQCAITDEECLSGAEQAIDLVVFGLRQLDGVDLGVIQRKSGIDLLPLADEVIRRHVDFGLAVFEFPSLRLTRKGVALYDSVSQDWFNLL